VGLKATLSKPYAEFVTRQVHKWSSRPFATQEAVFKKLIGAAKTTFFGKDHKFDQIGSYPDFIDAVPLHDYEDIKPYIDKIIEGENNVLWKGKPIYFCKTSGTTSGTKYIPITKESMPNHINSARNALLAYIAETGKANFVNGKMIFLQGSPELDKKGSIPLGRLSGIVANHVPAYLLKNRMPSYATNCIEDWETKVDAIIEETVNQKMTLISGIPSWVQMYFDRLLEKTGVATISDIFPHFSLFVHGGVNYDPYKGIFEKLIGRNVDSIETYPASEGFIAYQDSQNVEGLLLVLNSGIFYEFIPVSEYHNENPKRISLKDVELDVNYAIILNTNAGLWGYKIGDTVRFVSKAPYRIVVTGRVKHFISAFGEHVIAQEVEEAIRLASSQLGIGVLEFHVAPQINPENELPYHQWFIEFDSPPQNLEDFRKKIDHNMQQKNIYYKDLIEGKVLQPLKISPVKRGGFIEYMKSCGKLGGQNKLPRLANDTSIADKIQPFCY